MLQFSRWKLIAIALTVLISALFSLPNLLPADLRKAVDKYGMPIFVKAVFPKRNDDGAAAPQPRAKELAPPVVPLPDVTPEGQGGPAGAPAPLTPPGDAP